MKLFKRKILFIINPKSGKSSNKPAFSDIDRVLKNDFHQIDVVYSNYKGHATELATIAIKNNFDVVAAVGGDGTVNEVALALNGTGKSLAIIPCGSGNGLARHHKIPFNIIKALQVISKNNVIDHDSIKINDFTSFNVSGIGFDAHVAHLFGKDGKRGFITYVKLVMQQFNKYKEFKFRISDGEQQLELKGMMISIANASQFGNNARIAPDADTNDGKANVTIVRKMNVLQLPYFAYKFFDGTIEHSSFAHLMNSEKITISCENEMPLHVDGEVAGFASSFEITAHKSTLRLIIP